MNRWRVCKRGGVWRIYDGYSWHDTCWTLYEAHTEATRYAVFEWLSQPGNLAVLHQRCIDTLVELLDD